MTSLQHYINKNSYKYFMSVFINLMAVYSFSDVPLIPEFQDATQKTGIGFIHESGSLEKDYIIEVNGSGVALFDYDNDGDLDVYFVNGSYLNMPANQEKPIDRLYRNDGGWTFVDVTKESGLGNAGWGYGCAAADYDNDGDLDLYVTNWGPNCLYRNNGDGTFTEIAKAAGVDESGWSSGCAFGDYDLDGDLDLYVTNYCDFDPKKIPKRGEKASCTLQGEIPIHCGPKGLTPVPDTFYRNNGDGTFTDISESSGIRSVENVFGLGVIFLDYDLDGLPDIYTTNDVNPNYVFHNNGDGTFEETGLITGLSYSGSGQPQSGMGVDCGDLDGDGFEDIAVLNYAQDYNTFYKNEGDGFFTDSTKAANLHITTYHPLGWGLLFFDPDYDSDLDLFVANGHVIPQVDQTSAKLGYKQTNQLFLNDGKGYFEDRSLQAGEGLFVKQSSRGCAFGDLDGDGDQDIVINNMNAAPTILENTTKKMNHWLGVQLRGYQSNRGGIGSWVTVKTPSREIKRYHRGAFGYASQSELILRFGLGSETEIESVTVQWTTGKKESYTSVQFDTVNLLEEGRGIPAKDI